NASRAINKFLRHHRNDTGELANAFYVLNDRYLVIREPRVRKDRVGDFVPVALQGTLFVELVEGREDLQDRPLFLLDEWVAHNNGAAVATDRIRHDLWNAGNRPEVLYEQVQLTVYALALARAIEASDPRYFDREPQFLEFLAAELRRSRDIYREGRYMGPLASDHHEQYWRFFQ